MRVIHWAILAAVLAWKFFALPAGAQQIPRSSDRPPAYAPTPQQLADNPPAQPPNYRLQTNDLIQVKVFQEDDLAITTRIAADGTIAFPLIGRVKVGGLSVAEAGRTIRDLLEKDYLVKPQVSLSLLEYTRQRFTVLGQVQKPGTFDYPVEQALNLLEAIGYAGGYTRIGEPKKVTVKRVTDGREVIYKLNAKDMAKGLRSKIFQILPGDVVSVDESLF